MTSDSHPTPLRGLYAVTPETASGGELLGMVRAALEGGARLVQYRVKSGTYEQRRADAEGLLEACRGFGVPLIVNDDVKLAREIGADGVHVGRDDETLTEARSVLGDRAIVGVSCYDQMALARIADGQGASYVAFGSFFPSSTKPGAVRAPLSLLEEARAGLGVPVAAIGGITADNAPQLIAAGADLLAVVSDLFGGPAVSERARRLAALFRDR